MAEEEGYKLAEPVVPERFVDCGGHVFVEREAIIGAWATQSSPESDSAILLRGQPYPILVPRPISEVMENIRAADIKAAEENLRRFTRHEADFEQAVERNRRLLHG